MTQSKDYRKFCFNQANFPFFTADFICTVRWIVYKQRLTFVRNSYESKKLPLTTEMTRGNSQTDIFWVLNFWVTPTGPSGCCKRSAVRGKGLELKLGTDRGCRWWSGSLLASKSSWGQSRVPVCLWKYAFKYEKCCLLLWPRLLLCLLLIFIALLLFLLHFGPFVQYLCKCEDLRFYWLRCFLWVIRRHQQWKRRH